MKTSASAAPAAIDLAEDASGGPVRAWTRFWFNPTAPTGLHWIRFLAGIVFLLWLVPLTGERQALFSLDGYFDATAYKEASKLPEMARPPLNWSLLYVFGTSPGLFDAFWWGSIAVLVLFTLGVATRITALLTWLIVVSFLASPASHPDVDYILVLPAFYLMLSYLALGQWNGSLSPLERLLGPRGTSVFALLRRKREEPVPSYAANLTLRLLQVHFAILVVISGLHKLQVDHWWAGVAYWFPMHPPLQMDATKLQAARVSGDATLFVLTLAGYLALAWQLTFPLFAWRKRLRLLLLGGGLIGALGAVFLWGEPTFGPLYALCCLTYLTPGEWCWLTDRVAGPFERRDSADAAGLSTERKLRLKASTAVRQSS
jgi:hypothetical protein